MCAGLELVFIYLTSLYYNCNIEGQNCGVEYWMNFLAKYVKSCIIMLIDVTITDIWSQPYNSIVWTTEINAYSLIYKKKQQSNEYTYYPNEYEYNMNNIIWIIWIT